MAASVFAFGVLAVVYAIVQGQNLKSVDLLQGKVELYPLTAGEDLTREEIENSQPAVEDRVRELEAQAQAAPSGPAQSTDLTGTWRDPNGLQYLIEQYGSEAVVQEISPSGTTAVGSGAVQNGLFTFQYEAVDGSVGDARLEIIDSSTLMGTVTNYLSGTVPAEWHR